MDEPQDKPLSREEIKQKAAQIAAEVDTTYRDSLFLFGAAAAIAIANENLQMHN